MGAWVQGSPRAPSAFYDIDTPVTLGKLETGDEEYLVGGPDSRLRRLFLLLGRADPRRLEAHYGSPAARALYCSVDEAVYRPQEAEPRWDLSYLGTYSADRQPVLETAADRARPPRARTALRRGRPALSRPTSSGRPMSSGSSMCGPADHPAFYAYSRFTLNVTRAAMIRAGYSPSVRLFEAAACGIPIISDAWDGLETLFVPGQEIILADDADTVLDWLGSEDEERRRAVGCAGRARVLGEHTASHRAQTLERELRAAIARQREVARSAVAAVSAT